MLELALEMDVGRFASNSSPIILYVLRLLTRVEGFVRVVLGEACGDDGTPGSILGSREGFSDFFQSAIAPTAENAQVLRTAWAGIAKGIKEQAVPMLQAWVARAVDQVELRIACGLHAHLVLLHKNVLSETELSAPLVGALLSAQVFINVNWQPSTGGNGIFGVHEHELFDTFESLRHAVLHWLSVYPTNCDRVMEAIVRTITLAHERRSGSARRVDDSEEIEQKRALLARRWMVLDRPGHAGRLLPDTELASISRAFDRLVTAPTYEMYLRASVQAVDTEINLQLGEYTLKNHTLQALPAGIANADDFVSIFGVARDSNPIQCVEVQNTTCRTWLRLVGLRHDVQLWDVEPRRPTPLPSWRKYDDVARSSSHSSDSGRISSAGDGGESWIRLVLEPYRRQYLRDVVLYMPEWDHSHETFAALSGVFTPTSTSAPGGGVSTRRSVQAGGAGAGGGDGSEPAPAPVLKEVIVFREPPVVHVYDVVSHGRRFYRSLVASSDNAFCLHDMPCTLFLQGDKPRLVAGDPRMARPVGSSLLITRTLTKQLGEQTFIPKRLLHGLLPAALLESYAFWCARSSHRRPLHAALSLSLCVFMPHAILTARVLPSAVWGDAAGKTPMSR